MTRCTASGGHRSRWLILLALTPSVVCAWIRAGSAEPAVPAPPVSFAPAVNYPVGGMPISIVAGDFNADGHMDLAVARYLSGGPVILLDNGDGTFRAADAEPYCLIACYQLAVGDWNGDGNLDLALNDDPGTVRIYLGKGDGQFEAVRILSVAGRPSRVVTADFNADGKADLVFANTFESNSLSILLGGRAATFQPVTRQPVGFEPGCLVPGDFNGDGELDLVTMSWSEDHFWLLPGKGDGTFLPAQCSQAHDSPVWAACRDFNGDGKLDLVTANMDGDAVSVFLGRGDGTFQSPTDYEAGNLPVFVAVADLNGDHHLDLIVAHDQGAELDVLPGLGDGTFQTPVSFKAGAGGRSVAIADFNGDGRPDLATANSLDGTVSVLMNTTGKAGIAETPQSAIRGRKGPRSNLAPPSERFPRENIASTIGPPTRVCRKTQSNASSKRTTVISGLERRAAWLVMTASASPCLTATIHRLSKPTMFSLWRRARTTPYGSAPPMGCCDYGITRSRISAPCRSILIDTCGRSSRTRKIAFGWGTAGCWRRCGTSAYCRERTFMPASSDRCFRIRPTISGWEQMRACFETGRSVATGKQFTEPPCAMDPRAHVLCAAMVRAICGLGMNRAFGAGETGGSRCIGPGMVCPPAG